MPEAATTMPPRHVVDPHGSGSVIYIVDRGMVEDILAAEILEFGCMSGEDTGRTVG
jgi:hypothetical protein